jgi:hypothetical protein
VSIRVHSRLKNYAGWSAAFTPSYQAIPSHTSSLDRDENGAPTENVFTFEDFDKIVYRTKIGRYAATGLDSLLGFELSSFDQMEEVTGCSVRARRRLFVIRALYPRAAAALLTAQSNHCEQTCRIYQTTTNGTSVLGERTTLRFCAKSFFESEDAKPSAYFQHRITLFGLWLLRSRRISSGIP